MAAKKGSKAKAGSRTPGGGARAAERPTKKAKVARRAATRATASSAPSRGKAAGKKAPARRTTSRAEAAARPAPGKSPASGKKSLATGKSPASGKSLTSGKKGAAARRGARDEAVAGATKGSAEPRGGAAPSARGAADAAAPALREGDRAPSFELLDQAGSAVSSASLAGQPYVLYFYPKDDTPGCTTEACGFRDAIGDFESAGVRVLGVSPDSVASHQKFVGKYGLPFTLLSDPERTLATAYGVWALKKLYGRESMGIVRSTFLVDGEGVIRKVWRGVRVNGHIAEVQAAAAALG